jgi:hypothetical protein
MSTKAKTETGLVVHQPPIESLDKFFGGRDFQKSEAPRLAIGSEADGEGDEPSDIPVVSELYGTYLGSRVAGKNDDGNNRLMHRFICPYVVFTDETGPQTEVDVYGSFQLDRDLPSLPIGTPVRIVYEGMQRSTKNKSRKFKKISVFYPKGTPLQKSVFDAVFEEKTPF